MRRWTVLLDEAIRIPIVGIRVGLDAIFGVVPVLGDIVGGILSTVLIWHAIRIGAPRSLVFKMMGNIVIELLVGLIPVIGDFFDVIWRSNRKNFDMLEEYIDIRLMEYGVESERLVTAKEGVVSAQSSALPVFVFSSLLLFALCLGFYFVLTVMPGLEMAF